MKIGESPFWGFSVIFQQPKEVVMSDEKIWIKLKCCFGDCAGKDSTLEIPLSDYKRNNWVICTYGHKMPARQFVFVKKTDLN